MNKADKIKQYNEKNKNYNITNIKKLTQEAIGYYAKYGKQSLSELYTTYSNAKRQSWDYIIATYKPSRIIGVQGNTMTYSVVLEAENGDVLHITRDNNYLVEVA